MIAGYDMLISVSSLVFLTGGLGTCDSLKLKQIVSEVGKVTYREFIVVETVITLKGIAVYYNNLITVKVSMIKVFEFWLVFD